MKEILTNSQKYPNQVADLPGQPFVDWLLSYIESQAQERQSFLDLRELKPRPEKIRKFLLQIFLTEQSFLGSSSQDPGFLGFIIANLSESDDPAAESALEFLEKRRTELAAERDQKSPDNFLEKFTKLLEVLGLTIQELEAAEPKEQTRLYISEMSEIYSTSPWQTAIGSLVCYEKLLALEHKLLFDLISQNQALDQDLASAIKPLVNFNKLALNPYPLLEKIIFDEDSKKLVFGGAGRQLQAREQFYQSLTKYLKS